MEITYNHSSLTTVFSSLFIEYYIYDISNKILFTHNAHIILYVVLSSAYGYIMSSVRSGVHISTEISINSDYTILTSYVSFFCLWAYDRDSKYFLWKRQNDFFENGVHTYTHRLHIYMHTQSIIWRYFRNWLHYVRKMLWKWWKFSCFIAKKIWNNYFHQKWKWQDD